MNGAVPEILREYRSQNNSENKLSEIIKGECVTDFLTHSNEKTLNWGEILEFEVELNLKEPCEAGYLLVHWSKNGDFVANSEVRYDSDIPLNLKEGRNIIRIQIGPVHLVYGEYELAFSVFDKSRNKTMIQAFDFMTVKMTGFLGSGPDNLLPISVVLEG